MRRISVELIRENTGTRVYWEEDCEHDDGQAILEYAKPKYWVPGWVMTIRNAEPKEPQ